MSTNSVKSLINRQYGIATTWREYDPLHYRFHTVNDTMDAEAPVFAAPIFACKTAQKDGKEHFVGMANEDGHLVILNTQSKEKQCTNAHNNAIFELAWKCDQMQIITASGDHTCKLYDLEDGDIREVRMFCGHTRSVKTVNFRKDDSNVFATGSRDGNIILWDTRTDQSSFIGKPDCTIYNSHPGKDINTPSKSKKKVIQACNTGIKSVTGLVFQNSNTLISCGAGDGAIKIWDLRKHYTVHKKESLPKNTIPYMGKTGKNGFSNLTIDGPGIRLYANCLDNTIYCYNVATYDVEPVKCYTGHLNHTFYVKSSLNKDGQYLVSGSSDESAYIWNVHNSRPIVKLIGHSAEVTCVAWCNLKTLLPSIVTCSDDISYKIWNIRGIDCSESIRWKAEILPLPVQKPSKKRLCRLSDQTNLPKRPIWQCKNCQKATISNSLCENCIPTSWKRKADCDMWSESKRIDTDFGPRRLFAHLDGNFRQADNSDQFMEVLERREEDGISLKSLNKALESYKSTKNSINLSASPTVNLPNFVVDGTAPHIHYSPPKRKAQDWLTKLRVEKNLCQEMVQRTLGSSSPKSPKLEITPKSNKKLWTTPKSPLLRFFKVINNSNSVKNDYNVSCSPKRHGGFGCLNGSSSNQENQ
ncbi:protein lethal(2)denticleless [Euwallacea fornicatus]|uniref:protein lethal(2)denticleless n=1 Tax=Euwallacea fornicatus TaxID=995702 RepID=UPI00338F89C0